MGTNRRHIAGKEQENMRELCMAIEMPMEVTEDAVKFDREFDYAAAREGMEKLFAVQTWEEGLAELKKCLGEDTKGFKMLACMLHCCRRTCFGFGANGNRKDAFRLFSVPGPVKKTGGAGVSGTEIASDLCVAAEITCSRYS